MRLATISHSHVALRQQLFFQEMARQGHEVLMIAPGTWFDFKVTGYSRNFRNEVGEGGVFDFRTCKHLVDNIYHYILLGAKDLIEEFKPDWLYVQAEPGSKVAEDAITWEVNKRALFTWENIELKGLGPIHLPKYDLVVCGNPRAVELVTPHNVKTFLSLQVGVDTDHFQARPDVERNMSVGYIGRPAPEKGLPYLIQAYPGVCMLPWKDFKELPWLYSQLKVLVAYSQDVPHWREQAPNYVVLEALSCGSKVVTSDTAAMRYWLGGCPAAVVVEGHEQPDSNLRLDRVKGLERGIQEALDMEVGDEGRQWVIDRFSNPVVARRLLEVFSL